MAYDLLLERFLRYAKINTRSDENATRTPTTQSQVDFALNILKPELEELGLSNIHYLESNGYLVATLPANDDQLTRKIGFISHMDTADFNAEGVSPQVIESYDGGIIPLGTSGYNLDPADFLISRITSVRHLLRQMAPPFLELMINPVLLRL